MTQDDIDATISSWIEATNTHNTADYLAFFAKDAVLEDPSVGERFDGHEGIADYYERYFVGYDTATRLVSIGPHDGLVRVAVVFTGSFPGGQTGGVFDIRFDNEKIAFIHADLT